MCEALIIAWGFDVGRMKRLADLRHTGQNTPEYPVASLPISCVERISCTECTSVDFPEIR